MLWHWFEKFDKTFCPSERVEFETKCFDKFCEDSWTLSSTISTLVASCIIQHIRFCGLIALMMSVPTPCDSTISWFHGKISRDDAETLLLSGMCKIAFFILFNVFPVFTGKLNNVLERA